MPLSTVRQYPAHRPAALIVDGRQRDFSSPPLSRARSVRHSVRLACTEGGGAASPMNLQRLLRSRGDVYLTDGGIYHVPGRQEGGGAQPDGDVLCVIAKVINHFVCPYRLSSPRQQAGQGTGMATQLPSLYRRQRMYGSACPTTLVMSISWFPLIEDFSLLVSWPLLTPLPVGG